MTAALEGGEWSAARPGSNLPQGKTRYPFHRRLAGPRGRSERGGKSRPHRDSIPERPARNQSAACLGCALLPGKTRYPIYRKLAGPRGRFGRGGKSRPHRDSIPEPPARSQSLYRLSYRAQIKNNLGNEITGKVVLMWRALYHLFFPFSFVFGWLLLLHEVRFLSNTFLCSKNIRFLTSSSFLPNRPFITVLTQIRLQAIFAVTVLLLNTPHKVMWDRSTCE